MEGQRPKNSRKRRLRLRQLKRCKFNEIQAGDSCWEANGTITSDPETLPDCGKPSNSQTGNSAKLAREATCATWDPKENPNPPGCEWFTTPPRPSR